ncbi:MAG: hypothetical protein AMXMBFR82_26360 [Candidatus Hydrogenedentota bacterium]
MYELVARAGMTRGVTWSVGETPLVIGRDPDCGIRITDATVSRRHCKITLRKDAVWIEDLGSANTTLVNGRPARSRKLDTGDEIAVGSVRLMLRVHEPDMEAAPFEARTDGSTIVMAQKAVAFLKHERAAIFERDLSRTVADLADLFQLSQRLWEVSSSFKAVDEFLDWSRQRLRWKCCSVYLVRGDDEPPEELRTEGPCPDMGDAVARAVSSFSGMLVPLQKSQGEGLPFETLAVAPIVLGDRVLGAIALVSGPETTVYDESDLQLLMAAANSFAPFLHSFSLIEEMREENEQLRLAHPDKPVLVGTSRAMGRLRSAVRKAAQSSLPVIIQGETGTGKELVAHLIHELSARRDMPYFAINCAAIPRELFESEMFGYERGAFTGATTAKPGIVRTCDGGSLFLDEIGDLSLENQAKLLRFLDSGTFRPVGGVQEVAVDVRLIAATNRDLREAVSAGAFRKDLFYRLEGVSLRTPSLAERPSDIPVLLRHFVEMARRHPSTRIQSIHPDALDELVQRSWPGNVRELRNAVNRAIANSTGTELTLKNFDSAPSIEPWDTSRTLEQHESEYIARVLQHHGGRVVAAAASLGIARSTLYEKLAKYGIKAPVEPAR